MGNSITPEQSSNFQTLLTACRKKNIDEIKTIIENSKGFDFYYNGITFYHYLVVEAILYNGDGLKKLCDLIYEHRSKFGDCTKKPDYGKYIQLIYHEKEKNYTIWWTNSDTERKKIVRDDRYGQPYYEYYYETISNTHSLYGLDPMSFCLKIKIDFLKKNNLQDNLNIVIDLLNKLTNKSNIAPEICVVCKKNRKNIFVRNCNHVCMCKECLGTSTACPVCKKDIVSFEEIIL
ncbi:MAG: hypothetical protein Edafosvirus1_5 [Edafosvirus sp.]|uniref:RING-type domain-containing protein n=1 Tax=Edafosvirus sp. TaxID=2487765 RepID=A0A3G4ZTM2_9VIRU|nr:MAG: hypothetical protein Edafosvirus1_5 [Edafosvirus sp.]